MVTQLGLLTGVLEGHEAPLRAALAALPTGSASPFAKVRGTHNGRWVVIDTGEDPAAPRRAGGLDAPVLLCAAVIDPDPTEWLCDLLQAFDANAIWSHCPGWPAGREEQVGHLLAHRTSASLDFATWDAPVDTIRRALDLRTRVADFAVRTQGSRGDELVSAYRAEFPP